MDPDKSNLPTESGDSRFDLPKEGEVLTQYGDNLVLKLDHSIEIWNLAGAKRGKSHSFPYNDNYEQQVEAVRKTLRWTPLGERADTLFKAGDTIKGSDERSVFLERKSVRHVVVPERAYCLPYHVSPDDPEAIKLKKGKELGDWLILSGPSKKQSNQPGAGKGDRTNYLEDYKKEIKKGGEDESLQNTKGQKPS